MSNQVIIHKKSAVAGKKPTTEQLQFGEFAINTYDGKLYTKIDDGVERVINITSKVVTVSENPPSDPEDGSLWFDTNDASLNVYYIDGTSEQWISVDPALNLDSSSLGELSDVDLSTAPTNGQVIKWNGSAFVPADDSAGTTINSIGDIGDVDLSIAPTNGQALLYNSTSNNFEPSDVLTDYTVTEADVTQHQSALIITESQISDLGAYLTSSDIADFATETYVDTAVSNLIDTAPATLDTLNELAAALGDDPNFATTVSNSIGLKANSADLATVATSGDYTDLINAPTIPTNLSELTIDSDTDFGANKILYSNVYSTLGDLPSATSYHGMFAHVHGTGKAYYAHAGSWVELANESELFDGDYNSLTNTPTLFDGDYNSLSNTPTIPSALTDLGITDGTNGQILSTDGSGTFSFIDVVAGESGTSVTAADTAPSSPSEGDLWYNTTTLDLYVYYSNNWVETSGGSSLSSTDDLSEGSTNLYYTDARVQTVINNNAAGFITDYAVTEADVTQHQAALSITESQISDLQSYLTDYTVTETDVTTHQAALSITESQISDLQSYLTDYTVTEADVTTHQDALSITESQISDLQSYLTSETTTSLAINANVLTYTDETGTDTDIDLSLYLDDSNLARLVSGTVDANTGIATFTRDDATSFTVDYSAFLDDTNLTRIDSASFNTADGVLTLTRGGDSSTVTVDLDGRFALSSDIPTAVSELANDSGYLTSVAFADLTTTPTTLVGYGITDAATSAQGALADSAIQPADNISTLTNDSGFITDYTVTESDVTTHQAALSLTKSQISDLATSDLDLGTNKILYSNVYSNLVDLPSAASYHGMFAHVHGTGKAYYAHAGSWVELANVSEVFDGDYNSLTNAPTLFDGDYNSLTNTPTIPSALTDLGITDGTNGQILSTDGSGAFSFIDPASAGASVTISQTTPSSPSEGDLWFDSDDGIISVWYIDSNGGQWIALNGDQVVNESLDLSSRSIGELGDVDITSVAPTNGQTLVWNGTEFLPGDSGSDLNAVDQSIIPATDITYDLGSPTKQWRDIYVGPGSLYVNGSKVIEDNSGTINVTADENQSIRVGTTGTGQTTIDSAAGVNITATGSADITLTTSTGQIELNGDVVVDVTKSITSSNGSAITFNAPITVGTNTITAQNFVGSFSGTIDDISNFTSDDLAEGSTNLYYTDAKVQTVIDSNTAGFITDYTVTEADVTTHQAALSITESQISDLTHYTDSDARTHIEGQDLDMGTNKILYSNVYSAIGDLPSATNYHGMFAHVHSEGKGYFAHAGSWIELANASDIPSLSGYATETYVDTAVSNLVDAAPATLDTLNELAAALGDDPNFATTISNQIGLKANSADLATVATSGAYSDLTGTPTIPTAVSDLTNDTGFITDYTVTEADVTTHQAALSITEAQISDLIHYTDSDARTHIEGQDLDMGTNKILYSNVYSSLVDLPNASSYHGMFAHVHSEGKGYFAHAGAWVELANASDIPSLSGYATETYVDTALTDKANSADLSTVATSGDYNDLSNTPTIPAGLTDLGITDGTSGQVLATDGNGTFTFIDAASGGVSGGASVSVSDTAPSSPSEGDLWFNSDKLELYIYYSNNWIGVDEPANVSTNNMSWLEASVNTTLIAGGKYLADSSSGVITLTLPASPSLGDEIQIVDAGGSAGTNNITVDRNGSNISGLSENLIINIDEAAFGLVYFNATRGWVLTEK